MQKSKFGNNGIKSSRMPIYCMLAPFSVVFFLFTILPIITSVILSFTDFDLISFPDFNGFGNYLRMLMDDAVFPITLKNTLLFAIITGPVGFLLSFVLAWFINEFSPFVRTLLSFMFYAPALVGNGYYIWQIAFSSDSYGYINSLLLSMHLINEPITWLKDAAYVLPICMIVQIWQSMGVSFLANISGLQNISQEQYEAAAVDGIRSRWQELWYITLPSMKNMLLFSAVMAIQSSFSVSQLCIELAGYPSVSYSADTMVSLMNDVGTVRYEMGYASSIAVFLFVLMVLSRQLVNKLISITGK